MSDINNWRKFSNKKTPAIVPLGKKFYEYVKPGTNVLDIGCAFGRVSFELYKKGYNVVGIDFNENEIKYAKRDAKKISVLGSKIKFVVGNANDLPFPDNSFDAAVMVAFMVTIVKPEERIQVLKEAYRVLKDKGTLYLSAFGQNWDNEKYKKRYEGHFPITKEMGTFIVTDTHDLGGKELYRCHHYTEDELRTLIQNEFNILSWEYTTFKTPSGNTSNGFMIVAQK